MLAADHKIELVVSQPDRPLAATGNSPFHPSKAGRAVRRPRGCATREDSQQPRVSRAGRGHCARRIVVVAYGRLIPPWMLALPRLGCINLHASLLPRYRGAAPIQWAVAIGDTITGNTPCFLKKASTPAHSASAGAGHCAAPDCGGSLRSVGRRWARRWWSRPWPAGQWNIQPEPQNHAGATFRPAPRPRRRPHGVCRAHGHGAQESLARLSAMARRIHRARRQKLMFIAWK